MNDRILVAYATCAGSTLEVAQAIGKTLAANGTAVDVKPIVELQEDTALRSNGYRAVVIGSAVQHGNWLPEAVDFVKTNREYLAGLPVALFCVHIRNTADDPDSQRNRHAYLDQARRYVNPAVEGYFAGKFNRRGAQEMLPGMVARFVPTIDLRNWDQINGWAARIRPILG